MFLLDSNAIIVLLGINLLTFVVYGIDKELAKKHLYRISEATLLLLAALGGSIGAYLGMKIFRHKTKHLKFSIGIPVIFILQSVLLTFFSTPQYTTIY